MKNSGFLYIILGKYYLRERQRESMTYIQDFAKNLFKRSNIGVIIYLVLNTIIVSAIFESVPIGILVYIISLAIALSPLGEWILRLQTGSRKIINQAHINRLEPLFQEVLNEAREINPSIPQDVKLFMNDNEAPNAFATGRKTVCLTRGLLDYTDQEIKAVFAHELGHLGNKDTDLILLVAIGNFVVTTFFILFRFFFNFFGRIIAVANDSIGTLIVTIFVDVLLVFFMWLWTKLGTLLVMHSRRQNEFLADEFAFKLGYGTDLCSVLSTFGSVNSKGLWANLVASHPDSNTRIARLESLASNYEEELS